VGKETGWIVTGDFTPPTVIVAVRQRVDREVTRVPVRLAQYG